MQAWRYDCGVATNPSSHPLDEEIAEIYAAHPELKAELDEMERQLEAGELDGVDHEEMRRRFKLLVGDEG
jgi:hypothetical protein